MYLDQNNNPTAALMAIVIFVKLHLKINTKQARLLVCIEMHRSYID